MGPPPPLSRQPLLREPAQAGFDHREIRGRNPLRNLQI
jgi:hypothetical protein